MSDEIKRGASVEFGRGPGFPGERKVAIYTTTGVRAVEIESASLGTWKPMNTIGIKIDDASDGNRRHFNLRVMDGEGTTLESYENLSMSRWWRLWNWLRRLFGMKPRSITDDDGLVAITDLGRRSRP